ncbi:hypothetical protein OSCT_2568 [Oscillochloris trichoides DG-6]|uniref:Uncharacterized protein n=1 Tax=Oscillochloris trichoides DG-6 TaxID=765420 RepID=E1IGW7_9CHLR|nr:hypothetical protein [Oscillochloris trichoides]EFO79442.1 hypothetical protein OSCT_2568 [Oscillochloris trichoides DG-6]
MIMSGSREATLQSIQRIDIHGTIFYDLSYTHTGEEWQIRQARVAQEGIYAGAKPGDVVLVSYLMNVVTGVKRRD